MQTISGGLKTFLRNGQIWLNMVGHLVQVAMISNLKIQMDNSQFVHRCGGVPFKDKLIHSCIQFYMHIV